VGAVTHIPGINSDATGNLSAEPGGMLADFTTLKTFYSNQLAQTPGSTATTNAQFPLNYLWLHTRDDNRSLTSVRAALNSSQLGLSNLYDRRDMITELQNDPLSVDIQLLLSIGGATALVLALVGDLVASWLNVRSRRGSFVVLRALGANSRHIAALLTWEQVLVYLPALALGGLFGLLLAKLAVPTLIFTDLPAKGAMSELDNGSLYLLQQIVPVQVLIPLALRLAFIGLVVLCVLAIALMVRTAPRPLIAQELRLNED
jgi:ABC-type antimicrobial peptide transport system permease subunit